MNLLEMFPVFSRNDVSDARFVYRVFFCKSRKRVHSGGIFFSYFSNLIGGNFCRVVIFPPFFSFLLNHVFSVIKFCSNKKVVGVYAGSNIAMVTNKVSAWNRSFKKKIRESMRSNSFFFNVQINISGMVRFILVDHASVFVGFVNQLQKPNFHFGIKIHDAHMPYLGQISPQRFGGLSISGL